MDFFFNREILYKRNHDVVLLKCVDEKVARKILEEVHESFCTTYSNVHAMVRIILKVGYFWLTMDGD